MIDPAEILIREAKRSDDVEVSDLLHRLGLNVPSKEHPELVRRHWDRLWDQNPFYQLFPGAVHYGWVMEHKGRIQGFFGSVPRVYHFNGEPLPVAIASQWGVGKEYRKFTPLLCERFFQQNPIATKLVTTAIVPTGRIFGRYSGHPVPDPSLDQVHLVPLDLKKLTQHKLSGSPWLVRMVAGLVTNIIASTRAYRRIPANAQIHEVEGRSLDAGFQRFWEQRVRSTRGLIASRSPEFVQWYHATGNRGLTRRVFVHRSGDGIISGYVSIMEEPIPGNSSIKRYKVVDMLASSAAIRTAMLNEVVRIAFHEKADVLEFHLPGMIAQKDIPVKTLSRKVPQFPVFYQTTDPKLAIAFQDKNNWRISPYDGDTCLS